MDLRNMVREMVGEMVREALGGGAETSQPAPKVQNGAAPMSSGEVVRRARRRSRPRVKYVMVTRKPGKLAIPDAYDGRQEAAVMRAVHAAKDGITAKQLEKACGMGRKSVESAVWRLRTDNIIKSVGRDE